MMQLIGLILVIASPFGIAALDHCHRPEKRTIKSMIVGGIWTAGVLYTLGYAALYAPLRSYSEEYNTGRRDSALVEQNIFGHPLKKTVWMEGGSWGSGPVDSDGDPHGEWSLSSSSTIQRVWYHHGKQCTKSQFHRWSN